MGIFGKLFGGSDKGSLEEQFWHWFRINSTRMNIVLEAAMDKTFSDPNSKDVILMKKLFSELQTQFNKIDKNLTFEFGPVKEGKREFIVSADGIKATFPAVQKLVSAAPDLPDWKIIAFRPGGRLDSSIETPNGTLSPDDIWFAARLEAPKLALDVYVRGMTDENQKQMSLPAFLILDGVVGEYDVEMKIGSIDFNSIPTDPAAHGLKPLRELPEIVNKFRGQNN